jgi:hypothetical protein
MAVKGMFRGFKGKVLCGGRDCKKSAWRSFMEREGTTLTSRTGVSLREP